MAVSNLLAGAVAAAGLLAGNPAAGESWSCTNDGFVEVACAPASCETTRDFTPMQVRVANGDVNLCAYSACFEGSADLLAKGKSNLVIRSTLERLGGADGPTQLMLAINPSKGSGTMLWNGFANPLRCTAA